MFSFGGATKLLLYERVPNWRRLREFELTAIANMKLALYKRVPVDVALFSPLPTVLLFRAMWGKDRAFLRVISEGLDESARERGGISYIGKSI